MNLKDYIAGLPLDKAYYNAAFAYLEEREAPPMWIDRLEIICSQSLGMKQAYDFLDKEDLLFGEIYGKWAKELVDGRWHYTYPFVEGQQIPDGTREVVGPVGTQTSKWHKESLKQHAAYVVANLVKETDLDVETAVRLGVLHDVGKKYTSATNKHGGICCHEHAKVSAVIASCWLHKLPPEQRKTVFAVIYAHMFPQNEWNPEKKQSLNRATLADHHRLYRDPEQVKAGFYKELVSFLNGDVHWADRIMDLVYVFAKCDKGITEFTPDVLERIKLGEAIIRGAKI